MKALQARSGLAGRAATGAAAFFRQAIARPRHAPHPPIPSGVQRRWPCLVTALGLLAATFAAVAFSPAPALAAAIELGRSDVKVGTSIVSVSSRFIGEIDFSKRPTEIVFIPLNWTVLPQRSNDVDMFDGIVVQKGGFSRATDGRMRNPGEVTFRSATQCPLDGPLLPTFSGFQVCVPVEWNLLKCGDGSTGDGRVQMHVTLKVDFFDRDGVTFTDVPLGFDVDLRVVGPGVCQATP